MRTEKETRPWLNRPDRSGTRSASADLVGKTLLGAFPGMCARAHEKETLLCGPVADQAALHGVLAEIEALGLELLELRRTRD